MACEQLYNIQSPVKTAVPREDLSVKKNMKGMKKETRLVCWNIQQAGS